MKESIMVKTKEEIEDIRTELNRYMEYPDIFKEEIEETSKVLDILINKYMRMQNNVFQESVIK